MKRDRNILWPRYMLKSGMWEDLGTSVSDTYEESVDKHVDALQYLREFMIIDEAVNDKIKNRELINTASDMTVFSYDTQIQKLSLLGVDLAQPDILPQDAIARAIASIGEYWIWDKGSSRIVDYMAYIMNIAQVNLKTLWANTPDGGITYDNFVSEDDPIVAGFSNPNRIQNGGTYFPTAHIQLQVDNDAWPIVSVDGSAEIKEKIEEAQAASLLGDFSIDKFLGFFYSLCNYNLVVHSFDIDNYIAIIPSHRTVEAALTTAPPIPYADIIEVGVIEHEHVYLWDEDEGDLPLPA